MFQLLGFLLGKPNFGAIEIDWDSHQVTLKIEVRDVDGVPVTGLNVSLFELQKSNVEAWNKARAGHFERHCSLETSLPWIIRYRLAILFFSILAGKSLQNPNH